MTIFKNSLSFVLAKKSHRSITSAESLPGVFYDAISKNREELRVPYIDRLSSETFRNCRATEVKGLVLDWSGTVADRYVIAPAISFFEAFKKFGVDVTMQEVRGPMGLRKDLHIQHMMDMDSVREKWHEVHGRYPEADDVQKIYDSFTPIQLDCLEKYSDLLPGVADVTQQLQKQGLVIGTSTGFTREMVDVLLKTAHKQGYTPDVTVAGDEVINGARPNPHMIYKNMDLLNISNPNSLIKVDDTVGGVGEGLNAGCWSIGVSKWSNYVDIDSLEHEQSLSQYDLNVRRQNSRDILLASGAHYVIDDLNELPQVVNDINTRLSQGETPTLAINTESSLDKEEHSSILPPYF